MQKRRTEINIDESSLCTEVTYVVDEGTINEHIITKYFHGIEG